MACGSCGGARRNVNYEVTFKGAEPTRIVTPEEGGLATVRMLLAQSEAGGTYKAVQRAKP